LESLPQYHLAARRVGTVEIGIRPIFHDSGIRAVVDVVNEESPVLGILRVKGQSVYPILVSLPRETGKVEERVGLADAVLEQPDLPSPLDHYRAVGVSRRSGQVDREVIPAVHSGEYQPRAGLRRRRGRIATGRGGEDPQGRQPAQPGLGCWPHSKI